MYSVKSALPVRIAREFAAGVTSRVPAAMISVPTVTSARDAASAEVTKNL